MLKILIPVGIYLNSIAKKNKPGVWSVVTYWDQIVCRYGDCLALMFQDVRYSYKEIDEKSNQYAECFLELGIQQGNVVALCIENCPEFLIVLLGLIKVGATAALLNTNVTGKHLMHCLHVCGATRIIYHAETLHVIQSLITPSAPTARVELLYFDRNQSSNLHLIGKRLQPESKSYTAISNTFRNQVKLTDTVVHIFTSGTTGLPKAAKVNHLRFVGAGYLFGKFSQIQQTDRVYCTLPLYHASGLLIGWGLCLSAGATFVLRKKFSATQFWLDCIRYDVTIVQYIGELCRYLCNTPPSMNDRTHQVRLAIGNGLRPDVWTKFQARFNVPRIMEFYSATEGNTGFVNAENKLGAVGYMSSLIRKKHPAKLIRVNLDTMEPMRDRDTNACIECDADQVGELIAEINNQDVMRRFDGYSDAAESEKKMLQSVFRPGDLYFRSGDLMKIDAEGFVYFIDRTGDTYRWKGENVSTAQITQTIASLPDNACLDVAVYGVSVGTHDGRAGMAMIYPGPGFCLRTLYSHLLQLPAYERPYFVRLTDRPIRVTETYKHRKTEFATEGFDPRLVKHDRLYVRDDEVSEFVALSETLYDEINSGRKQL